MIIKTAFAEKTKEIIIRRTWKERLFSLPWHPLKKYKKIKVPKEYPQLTLPR